MQLIRSFGFLAVLGVTALSASGDWPHWRGPDRTGIVSANGFEPNFATDGADIAWQKEDIGVGYSAVTVANGHAYTAGWADGQTTFYCFDADTGEPVWTYAYKVAQYDTMNVGGPSGTPTVDHGKVYHQARDGRLMCFDAAKGELLWEKNLPKVFGVEVPRWGFSGSPIVLGDHIFIDIGRIVALDKVSGDEVWRTDNYTPSYSTPAPFSANGKDYLAAFPGDGLVVVDRSSGQVVAHHPWKTQYNIHAATPIVHDDGKRIFISSGYNTGGAVLAFDGQGLSVVWESKDMRNQMPTCVLIDGYLYGFDDTRLKCLNVETGEEMWNQRGLGQGTVIAAGETLIVLSAKGELITAPAKPEGFEPISRAQIINEDKVWVSPTLIDGRIYCRGSRGSLVCINAGTP